MPTEFKQSEHTKSIVEDNKNEEINDEGSTVALKNSKGNKTNKDKMNSNCKSKKGRPRVVQAKEKNKEVQ